MCFWVSSGRYFGEFLCFGISNFENMKKWKVAKNTVKYSISWGSPGLKTKREDEETYVGRACKTSCFFTGERRRKTTKKNDLFSSTFRRFLEKKTIKKATRKKTAKNFKKNVARGGHFCQNGFFWAPQFYLGSPGGSQNDPLFLKTSKKSYEGFPVKGSWEASGSHLEPLEAVFCFLSPF